MTGLNKELQMDPSFKVADDIKQISFRLADSSDAVALCQLVNSAYQPRQAGKNTSRIWTHESDFVSSLRVSPEQINTDIHLKDSALIVAMRNAKIIGCVQIKKSGTECELGLFAVDPNDQQAGVGKELLAQSEQVGHQYFRPTAFKLFVISQRLELIAFYLRRGYKKTGLTILYSDIPNAGTPIEHNLTIEVLEKENPFLDSKEKIDEVQARSEIPSTTPF